MNTFHPLERIPEGWPVWTAFIMLLVLFLVFGQLTKQDLKTDASPWNAVSLELAGFKKGKAQSIIASWTKANKLDLARRHLYWDTYFIFVYSTWLALGSVMAARVLHGPGTNAYRLALCIAWLPWLAGLLDFVENYAMWKMLDGFEGETLPRIATACATVKFLIIIATGVYSIVGLAVRLWRVLAPS